MRGELVALDLETTGFDPIHDTIIEIGLVRLQDGQIVAEESRLVNPERPIPDAVIRLTGISNEQVAGKPPIAAAIPWLRAFIGSAPIVGHNVNFDVGFLQPLGIVQNNPRLDTYDLAAVLMPRAPRYSLGSLASQVGVDLENAHRALDDARATALLYWLLWQKALALPLPTLREIVGAAQGIEWEARLMFESALRERANEPVTPPALENGSATTIFNPPVELHDALQLASSSRTIEAAALDALVDENGPLTARIPGYEKRPQQLAMMHTVLECIEKGEHALIEAGTGIGKTLAYLAPAALWATGHHERVIISTNTIALQEQLIAKDVPLLQQALDQPFRAAILKGRGHYLCPRRLTILRQRRPTGLDELRLLAKILVWLLESQSGDRAEITLRGPVENNLWSRFSAEDEDCSMDRCAAAMQGACPFYKARKAAEAAHLLIINHALLLADVQNDNRVLPDYQYLIIDEGHHLEEATTSSLTFRLDEAALQNRLADLGGPRRGFLSDLLNKLRTRIPDKDYTRFEAVVQNIGSAAGAMGVHSHSLFAALRVFASEANNGDDNLGVTRVTPQLHQSASFSQIAAAWGTLREFFEVIGEAMRRVTAGLNRLEEYRLPDYDALVSGANAAARYLEQVRQMVETFVTTPDSDHIYWLSTSQNTGAIALHSAPLHIGKLLEQHIWNAKKSVILTSATLKTDGSFDHIRDRLRADRAQTLEFPPPFNYRDSTLVFIPDDIPEPTDRVHYQEAVERGLIELAATLDGRVLALFTSYAQLRQTAQAIAPRLALGNITVFDQSDSSSAQTLLENFKATRKAILLGTKSLWEGIDVPGDALSALVIVRLPFATPNDPVFVARSESYSKPFDDYTVPDAILRFRQGFGRLIRSQTDRGVVAIFDRRIATKGYGKSFLRSLPDCTVQRAPLATLPTVAQEWINRKTVRQED